MKVHGVFYYQGYGYDDNGHTDDYDLMFQPDGKDEICMNGLEEALFPECYHGKSFIAPMSVHDRLEGTLDISFTKEKRAEGVIC